MDTETPEEFKNWILETSKESPEKVIEEFHDTIDENENYIRAINITDAFQLGNVFKGLQGSIRYSASSLEVGFVLQQLVVIELHLMNPHIESDILEHIRRRRRKISRKYSESSEEIDAKDLTMLKDDCEYWKTAIEEEFNGEQRIPVLNKGMLDLEGLLDSPNDFFKEDVWNWLDERPRNDIKEACRTLAINSSTASVMLSLRAVEYCLRKWYEHRSGDELQQSWGRVLSSLEDEYDDKRNRPAVLSNLDYLRDKRNEVNHPQKNPDWEDAENTLYSVRQTISDIRDEFE